ncbi:MAG: universal stress protein [Roseovarius sp.]|nr:universal stress protein [Roseovarius sp.]
MYKHVLVPVSFEEDRDVAGALKIARHLAGADGRITILHVMEQIPSYAISYMPPEYLSESRAAIGNELSKLAAEVPNAQGLVIDGHSGRSILDWAGENAVDCIVIASHRRGMQALLLGSTASQVVRHAACAVHVIR